MTSKKLFIELKNKNIIFQAIEFNKDNNYKVLDEINTLSLGLENGNIIDLEECASTVQDCLFKIERKLDFTFNNVTLIINNQDAEIINLNNSKKLHGDQLTKEDISYIINNAQKQIIDNSPNKEIIHLFNTSFFLDGEEKRKLPLGLAGDFYTHQLSFFLIKKNILKNLKILFGMCNLTIQRIIDSNFLFNMNVYNLNSSINFFCIELGKEKSNLALFYNGSFCFLENFNFGTNIIKKDVSKLCSIELDIIDKIISEINFEKEFSEELIDKKYFNGKPYRKISISYIKEIMLARLNELLDIIFVNNINIKHLKTNIENCFIFIEDQNIRINLRQNLFDYLIEKERMKKFLIKEMTQNDTYLRCNLAAKLINDGWLNEVLSIIQPKKSFISRVFTSLFGE